MLLEEHNESVSITIKRLAIAYARWFNRRYDRVGHLFQDRFMSRPVEDDAYFTMAIQYIHFNPVVAGLCERPDQYAWSSRPTLGTTESLVDQRRLAEILSVTDLIGAEAHHVAEPPILNMMLLWDRHSSQIDDEDVWEAVARVSGASNGPEFQRLLPEKQYETVRMLLEYRVPVNQVARLTGLGRKLVTRWRPQQA
jgi:hypothetical protein